MLIINTFSPAWWIMACVQILIVFALQRYMKTREEDGKRLTLIFLFVFICFFYVWYKSYLIWWSSDYDTCIANELPIALCQIATIYGAIGVATGNDIFKGFGFYVGTLCSLMGMLMPVDGFSNISLLSPEAIGFYGFHGLVFVQSVLIYTSGLYKPDNKHIIKIVLLLMVTTLCVHGINALLRMRIYPESNYIFTFSPENNAILQLLYRIIGINFIYLLPLFIPLGIIFYLETVFFRFRK